MIRYAGLTRQTLEGLIDTHDPAWRGKAATRTAASIQAGRFSEGTSIWGDVKLVFMALQKRRCIFCERPLAAGQPGRFEQDVENFRPKNAVKAWPPSAKGTASPKYPFPTGAASASGYFWLAHEIENYAAACKPCNSARKSSYFPIKGARGSAPNDVRALNAIERPLLIYPLTDADDDPATLIAFEGISARPVHASGDGHDRAIVTIDFFDLNGREELWEDRFRAIQTVFLAMEVLSTSAAPGSRAVAQRALDDATADHGPQASCARSFLALMKSDAGKAWAMFQAADSFVRSQSSVRI